jgi:phosphonopyruvate decarboxylase
MTTDTEPRTDLRIDRRIFVSDLVSQVPAGSLFVSGLGAPSYDLFAAGDRDLNFYLWGAMGGSVPFALGLALAQPERPVLVITGDGELLMGVGSLATVAAINPDNLTVVVLDNGHFGETGMQKSHTSHGTDLTTVARGFGLVNVHTLHRMSQLTDLVASVTKRTGTTLGHVLVSPNEQPRALPNRDGAYIKNRFRAALGIGAI